MRANLTNILIVVAIGDMPPHGSDVFSHFGFGDSASNGPCCDHAKDGAIRTYCSMGMN